MRVAPSFALVLLLAAPLYADRVRVVVVTQPQSNIRANVISALDRATDVEPWGDGAAFAAEIDREDLDALRNDSHVRAIAIDDGGGAGLTESLPHIGADAVHLQGIDGRGTTVAVLDSGIDTDHPAFTGRITGEACFCDNLNGTGCCPGGVTVRIGTGSAEDDQGHGTHVAGIVSGVAPSTYLVAVKVLDSANRFNSFTQIYRALEWIADHRPEVDAINMSLGSDALVTDADCGSHAVALGLQPVISRLRERGVLIAASSGNNGATDRMWLPACMSEVLGVGATFDNADNVATFTNSSVSLDLLAPGVSITSTARGGGTTTLSGTSMAAPHVAGLIALMKQVGGRAFPSSSIQTILENSGKPVVDPRNSLTVPRIDALVTIAATPPKPPAPRRRAVRH
ncbi:MAG TPA: S8 family serine peptidase [Thermoanaerobaculia bacterium]|nr:S8 family serine peptidase [Thermoanaerobaculia bacterium]